jgi:hypothetical protein
VWHGDAIDEQSGPDIYGMQLSERVVRVLVSDAGHT